MAVNAPNASYHHTALGIKGADLTKDQLAPALVGIRQTGFEDGNEITTETDEGHTGVSNIDMGSYRTKAESAPNWEDGLRYGQGFEDYFYLLLGRDQVTTYVKNEAEVDGVYQHMMSMPSNVTDELPLATIYHGFQKTSTDGRVFNNAMLNELEVTFSADNKPSIKPTFVSDYNIVNTINPSRDFVPNHLSRTVMAQHTSVLIGEVGSNDLTSIDCFSEASFTINNNAESQACHDDAFGQNTKLMGAREVTGSITMPWHDATKYFETEYEAYEKYAHIVSEMITQKKIQYDCYGGMIQVEDAETHEMVDSTVKFRATFTFPVIEVTNVTSTKSGSDAKELTFEWKGIEQANQSYMTARFITDLEECHIADGTNVAGISRSDIYPPLKDANQNNIAENQKFAPYKNQ